ncbi:N-acetylmuramoyl-L-alanine amidase, partial [Nocardioides sp.]|uniref:N-acetylmuramoyl-L-alanine amidase n=1 Tax=Nocardioides sp. TaxID=35761 RepID=UPI0027338B23
MPPSKARYITACQQILALGVVLAVLAPAASVVSLDVVRQAPGEQLSVPQGTAPSAPPLKPQTATVETAPVDPVVTEVAMSAPVEKPARRGRVAQRPASPAEDETHEDETHEDEAHEDEAHEDEAHEDEAHEDEAHEDEAHEHGAEGGRLAAVSDVTTVEGFGAVGVVWSSDEQIEQGEILVEARTLRDGVWSPWEHLDYSIEDGPHEESDEGRVATPGTEPLIVGEVDAVQARATTPDGDAPADLRLAVVEPGASHGTEKDAGGAAVATDPSPAPGETAEEGEDAIVLQSSLTAPRPEIFTRAQWGADEKMRSGKPTYARVNAGVVHHTVTSNSYSESDVPKMIRSIYAYHTKSRGWSDIGYNFLVDRFGRVWEGRFGGVDKAVQGAHAINYNQYSFGVSALGNYDVKEPPKKMVNGIARITAWKLGIHGVDASSTTQKMGSKTFRAIIGHRDVGSTACPGRYLYAKLPNVRRKAARRQGTTTTTPAPTPAPPPTPVPVPRPTSNLVGSPYPDLVMRRSSDQRGVILPTEGVLRYSRGKPFAQGAQRYSTMVA